MQNPSRPSAGFFLAGADPARVCLGIAAAAVAAPFVLFAEHRPPLPSFYDEWLGAALAILAVLAYLSQRRSRAAIPELALWLVLFAAWLALQASLREPAYAQLPMAGIAYVILAAQLAWLGHALAEHHGAERVADVLAGAILAAAAANAAIGIVQFYGVPRSLSGIIAETAGPRSVGHVGQANLFADYLALGQASLLYLVARGRLRVRWLWLAGALLVLGSAYSQSRAVVLYAVAMAAAAFWLRSRGREWRELARHAGWLALATLGAVLAIPRLHGALDRVFDEQLIGIEPRLALWALAWRLAADSPWLGVGWGEFAGAAYRAGLPALWTSPHNLFLQLAAEAGFIGAALILIAALRWGRQVWTALRDRATLPLWWVAALLGTLGVHALVEYPLWYAHVLGLAALVAGIASRPIAVVPGLALRGALGAASACALVLLGWTLFDYQRFQRAYFVASGRTLAAPAQVSLSLQELRAVADGPLGAHAAPWLYVALPPSELSAAMGERVMRRWPSAAVAARHAGISSSPAHRRPPSRRRRRARPAAPACRRRK